jgi:hypothetical protein
MADISAACLSGLVRTTCVSGWLDLAEGIASCDQLLTPVVLTVA